MSFGSVGYGNRREMTNSSDEPIPSASEADLVEQTQELDGSGSLSAGPDVSPDEANIADAVEQGAHVTLDEDAYPHERDEG